MGIEAGLRFSLILATLERTKEVKRFLDSLDAQTHREFELIVVDQNTDARITSILEPYQESFPILHLRRPLERGLSRARNVGLPHVQGAVVTCPDDDCWYPPRLLEQVAGFLNERPGVDAVSGRMGSEPELSDKDPLKSGSQAYMLQSPVKIIRIPGMWGLFLRAPVVEKVGEFDETLGIGAGTPWGAGEDTDYYLRILKAGFDLYANPDLVVFHPAVQKYYTKREDLRRSYRYGAGITRVWKRHRLPLWYFAYEVLRSSGGVLLSLMQAKGSKAYWHWGALRGKLRGWFSN